MTVESRLVSYRWQYYRKTRDADDFGQPSDLACAVVASCDVGQS